MSRLLTFPVVLSELDRVLEKVSGLRTELADTRGCLDTTQVLLVQANEHNAALAVEYRNACAEVEALRQSLTSTTELVAGLTEERAVLRCKVAELSSERDDWRAASGR